MGTSNWQNISYCIELIRQIQPKTILDIGVGYGRWGMVSREFLEVWNGRIFRDQWQNQVDGIEIFPSNIDEYHRYFYNQIHLGDAYNVVEQLDTNYDLIILGDVLEHFDKTTAHSLMHKCLAKGENVLLNIPIGQDWEQDELYENEYEKHRSFWTEEELDRFPVIRKRFFKDYISRDFATYLFSNIDIFENGMKQPSMILSELKSLSDTLHLLQADLLRYEKLYAESKQVATKQITIEEDKIIASNDKDKKYITIKISEQKNHHAKSTEAWIYNIRTNLVKFKDFKTLHKEGHWESREDTLPLTGEVLVSWQTNSLIDFPIIGDSLVMTCLTHPWSGCIEIYNGTKLIKLIDLYAEQNKVEEFVIDLRDE